MYIDTHTHLYDEQHANDEGHIQRAIDAGVTKLYMPNCSSATIEPMLKIANQLPRHCFAMMGLHPCYVKENYKEELAIVEDWLKKRKFYAVGEIGLDYYWDLTFKAQQIETFETQIDWALHYDLPIVIHSREAIQACIDIVAKKQNGKLTGIFHSFGGNAVQAQQLVDIGGFYFGIGGVLTYKKSLMVEVVKNISLAHMVLETDAPYLPPVPYRGKLNESAYLPIIADKIAELKNIPVEEVAAITTQNAEIIFNKRMD